VGDVGRTDLPGPDNRKRLSRALYHSLHERILLLGDGVMVLPGHAAGSVCGGDISERPFSTIGLERSQNPMLQLSEEEFFEPRWSSAWIGPLTSGVWRR
jgi:hydroxyacylglutathione hydrolase